ncbi:MAG: hypothetical protein WC242_04075 [Candidatus Paceibacterota bacterium]|jgi:hypothetical protein
MKIDLLEGRKNKEFRENGRRLILAEICKLEVNILNLSDAIIRISASIKDNSSTVEVKIVYITLPPGPIESDERVFLSVSMTIDEFKALLRTME